MSLISGDGYGGRPPAGVASGSVCPRLTSGAAYGAWVPQALNWAARNGVDGALRRAIPGLEALMTAAEQWEQEAEDAILAAALGGGSSSSSVKKEDSEEAAAAAVVRASRAEASKIVGRSKRVYGALYEAIPEELREQIPSLPGDAFGLWKWLEGKFQSKEADSVGALLERWSAMRMEPDESFDAYRARVHKLRALLAAAQETISPANFAFVLIDRLQPRYAQAVLALKAGGTL